MRHLPLLPVVLALCLPLHAESLSADGRIGKIIDSQGIASIKPMMQQRWTLVEDDFLLQPGDWLRTDVRGANALHVRMLNGAGLILGPGTLVETVDKATLKLIRGELEVAAPKGTQVFLHGPGDRKLAVEGSHVYRADKDKFEELGKEPNWLQGFKGTVTTESMGSLLAKVEGRNVPLTVGYHKVSVTIRDQIARTVIEESFVNHTDSRLEGVFYFPLPQDASISDFGMWIGNELVMADVVEKQRAREIYETILREKRDPGLLEWSGGNIFKARVFPIFAHSEKRITITYTQVLPLKGGKYRYTYALQSEMLELHPLRELALDVRIHSALPLKGATCTTHDTRTDRTKHSAHLEFSAQEYTPESDFEVEIEIDQRNSPIVLIPHRRGDDGYFLLTLNPPDADGGWQRAVIPDGEPLEVLILADTSGSMGEAEREAQDAFIAALLSSLGEKDRFNLAVCDVDCQWFSEEPQPVDESNAIAARDFLAARVSLGWSDLDQALASALGRAGPNTHVIYLGDGIITTGDGDPVSFAKRVRRLYEGKSSTCHAVAVGSSYESVVLNAIASLGGGSVRTIESKTGPAGAASDLLGEVTQPALRDLSIEFKGLRTARVYPERLPNLPAGSQQILVGRYLPEGRDVTGEVVVSGTKDGKRVAFRAPVSLKDAEKGNSFIPRLWARKHLDLLLGQGRSPETKEEVIALSEEYNIMTPYTSFLVLESDADRERFKVKRRFRMRDGEKFFAEGRDAANFELLQKQMKRAGNWRLGLRRQILWQLARMGRDIPVAQPSPVAGDFNGSLGWVGGKGGYWGNEARWKGSHGRPAASRTEARDVLGYETGEMDDARDPGAPADETDDIDEEGLEAEGEPSVEGTPDRPPTGPPTATPEPSPLTDGEDEFFEEEPGEAQFDEKARKSEERYEKKKSLRALRRPGTAHAKRYLGPGFSHRYPLLRRSLKDRAVPPTGEPSLYWLNRLFPSLAGPSQASVPEAKWPEDAQKLAESLLGREHLLKLPGGIEVVRRTESYDTRRNTVRSVSSLTYLIGSKAWLSRSEGNGSQAIIDWCDGKERGTLGRAFRLGRTRRAEPFELSQFPRFVSNGSLASLAQALHSYRPAIEKGEEGRVILKLPHPSNASSVIRFEIDTKRNVLLSRENRSNDRINTHFTYKDFVDVAGHRWPQRVDLTGANGKTTVVYTYAIKKLAPKDFQARFTEEMAPRKDTIFISPVLPKVLDAKQAILDKKAGLESQLVMAAHFASSQQWDRVREHWDEAKELVSAKPGARWIEDAVLKLSRRQEELKQRLFAVARGLAPKPEPDELFLANHIRSQARGSLQTNEMLLFLDAIKPVIARQPERTLALKSWQQERINYLRSAGQHDEAVELQKVVATQYAWDYNAQYQYARGLVNRGDYPAAYRWIDQCLSKKDFWQPHEEDNLRQQYVQFLEGQGRIRDVAKYLVQWVADKSHNSSLCQRYLSALMRTGEVEKANELIGAWMKEGRARTELEAPVSARLTAAVNLALGQGYNYHIERIDERWYDHLAETVRFFARHPRMSHTADRVMNDRRFRRTDVCRAIRREYAKTLTDKMSDLNPSEIQRFVNWTWPNDPAVERETWKQIARGIEERWADEANLHVRNQFGQTLIRILSGRCEASEYLAFLHRQWREGPGQYRAQYANQLFNALLSQAWSQEYEDEAFDLLKELSGEKDETRRLSAQVSALYRLTDWAASARYRALVNEIKKKEDLSRTELKAAYTESRRKAREGTVKSLVGQTPKQPPNLRSWLKVERLYLQVILKDDLKTVVGECWERLGPEPPKHDKPLDWLDSVLLARHLQTLQHLATRSGAEPALTKQLLAWIDKAILQDSENPALKHERYRLLVALDRPDDIEKCLREWIRPDKADTTWRVTLGYLMAERNRLDEAVRQFEAVEAADELGPREYRNLADWYLVLDDRKKHEEALIGALMTTPEHRLSNRLYRELRPWQNRQGMPEELGQDVIRIFTALFRKSSHPQNYVWQLREFYRYSKDFRLLECMPEGIIGHTAGQVYPFLQRLRDTLNEIRDEATADTVVESLAKVRERAKTQIDKRALDFLLMQIKRRASEVKNQPGQHVPEALAAMKRCFKGEWTPGEKRLMADLLASLGRISQAALAQEQLSQLATLHRDEKKGSLDRLHIARRYAETLWSYSKWDEALDQLWAAIEEFRQASGGTLPSSSQGAMSTFVSYLESRRQYGRAEKFLLTEIDRPVNQQMRNWYKQRLYDVYRNALYHGSEVSLGKGQTLFEAVEKLMFEEIKTGDHNHRYSMVDKLCHLYRTAKSKKVAGATEHLRDFAWKRFPDVLGTQTHNYQNMIGSVAGALHDLISPREGLAFLIDRGEKEPAWLRASGHNSWRQHAWSMAYWRHQTGDIGDLTDRLLKIVCDELRRDLESQRSHNRAIYYAHHSYYWKEKAGDFARVAEEVYAKRKNSGSAVKYIANYFFHGLGRRGRAIEVLFEAYGRELLDESGQSTLADYLHQTGRYQESIPVLQKLVKLRPDNLNYRVRLMHAYFRSGKEPQLLALLKATDAFFHEKKRWNEGTIATLAQSCLSNQLYEQCAAYYKEVIPLHQRSRRNRGIGGGTLSTYYRNLSQAHQNLGRTADAVEAAAGAIVSWGSRHDNRRYAIQALRDVLAYARDLDNYVKQLDKQVEETGLENPVVRKAIGQVYLSKNQFVEAARNLRLAIEVQPNDPETHQALIQVYDKQQDEDGAMKQLLASARLSRRNIQLYKELGARFQKAELAAAAERAYTTTVEMLPNESESHTMLAEIRQQQERWDEAIVHWQQVARIRALEPTGLLKLAAAQIHQMRWGEAKESVDMLLEKTWPSRFGDVHAKARKLLQQVEAEKGN